MRGVAQRAQETSHRVGRRGHVHDQVRNKRRHLVTQRRLDKCAGSRHVVDAVAVRRAAQQRITRHRVFRHRFRARTVAKDGTAAVDVDNAYGMVDEESASDGERELLDAFVPGLDEVFGYDDDAGIHSVRAQLLQPAKARHEVPDGERVDVPRGGKGTAAAFGPNAEAHQRPLRFVDDAAAGING